MGRRASIVRDSYTISIKVTDGVTAVFLLQSVEVTPVFTVILVWLVGLVLVIYHCAISCSKRRDLEHVSFFSMVTLVDWAPLSHPL